MLTNKEIDSVLSSVEHGFSLRVALGLEGKQLDEKMQKWFLEDIDLLVRLSAAKSSYKNRASRVEALIDESIELPKKDDSERQ